jgi:hypothetical protein
MKQLIDVLPVEIIFENPDALLDFIRVQCPTSQTT